MCSTPIYMGSLYVHLRRRFDSKGLLIALLATLAVALPTPSIIGAEPTPQANKDSLTKPDDSQTQKSENPAWLDSKKPLDSFNTDKGPGGALLTMIVYSLIIVVLGVAAVLVIKKLLPRIQRSAGKNLSIIETAYISPRSSVHLLRVGTKKYLISRSGDGVSLLAEVTQALDDEEITPGSAE